MPYFNYTRRRTTVVNVGGSPLGGNNPIRLQSMTNTPTTDTNASVAQAKRIIEAGGEYVRLATQGVREAENLMNINIALRQQDIMTPIVADVHFNPDVANVAALYAEKVRINPGNYVDPARTFKQIEYTPASYAKELGKLRARFTPFLAICRENATAIRLGVNHGSLSDRIMSLYGDTPEGMVESCMEFLRICREEKFDQVVISIKSSNTVVMVQTVRLLVAVMEREKLYFPLHLGVTEAGDGEDGRIKSAFGIGALLADGLGDTIRVSLSEAPEREIPVARKLRDYITARAGHPHIIGEQAVGFDYLSSTRRPTKAVAGIGANHHPVVISARMESAEEIDPRFKPDYIYVGRTLPEERLADTCYIIDADQWKGEEGTWPVFTYAQSELLAASTAAVNFLFLPYSAMTEDIVDILKRRDNIIVISQSNHPNPVGEHRALVHRLVNEGITNPVVFFLYYQEEELESLQIKAAADMGPLIIDGLCDGIFLYNEYKEGAPTPAQADAISYGILQAGRVRVSKTEYIACPGCGRTLFDLETTIARIREATSHLTGLKIGIMGCIVNGPGEMADADYGYVGAGRGKVSLYRRHECVEKNIPEENAVDKLLELIRADGAM